MYTQDDVSLLMVNWNGRMVMELALKSYVKQHYSGEKLKLGLVDNFSTDGSKEWLIDNDVPFMDFNVNVGHENAINILYKELRSPCMLICDTDLEFLENIYDKYLHFIDENCKLVGDYITGDQLGSPIKPRVGAWMMMTDARAMKEKGVAVFRDKEDWSYDVGSQYTESVLQNGFAIHHVQRYNENINDDLIGMNYPGFYHYGKMSWDVHNKHKDRISEVEKRMRFIKEERLPMYSDVDIKGKFKWL